MGGRRLERLVLAGLGVGASFTGVFWSIQVEWESLSQKFGEVSLCGDKG